MHSYKEIQLEGDEDGCVSRSEREETFVPESSSVIEAPEYDQRADFDTKQGTYSCRQVSQSVSSAIGTGGDS